MYAHNDCIFHYRLPPSYQYMRNWNKGYMQWAQRVRIRRFADPVILQVYSEVLQKFRLAAQGKWGKRRPPERLRSRVEKYFDPPIEGFRPELQLGTFAQLVQGEFLEHRKSCVAGSRQAHVGFHA